MITEFILSGFQTVVQSVLSLIPNLPAMSDAIWDGTTSIISTIHQAVGMIAYLYTPPIAVFVFTIILAILLFDPVYKLVMWILHKARG